MEFSKLCAPASAFSKKYHRDSAPENTLIQTFNASDPSKAGHDFAADSLAMVSERVKLVLRSSRPVCGSQVEKVAAERSRFDRIEINAIIRYGIEV